MSSTTRSSCLRGCWVMLLLPFFLIASTLHTSQVDFQSIIFFRSSFLLKWYMATNNKKTRNKIKSKIKSNQKWSNKNYVMLECHLNLNMTGNEWRKMKTQLELKWVCWMMMIRLLSANANTIDTVLSPSLPLSPSIQMFARWFLRYKIFSSHAVNFPFQFLLFAFAWSFFSLSCLLWLSSFYDARAYTHPQSSHLIYHSHML